MEESFFEKNKNIDLIEEYSEEEEDIDGFYWPRIPKEIKLKIEKNFNEKFFEKKKEKIKKEEIEIFMIELGFPKESLKKNFFIFDEERKLNREKELNFTWSNFKDFFSIVFIENKKKKKKFKRK